MKHYIILGLIVLTSTTLTGQGLGVNFMDQTAQSLLTNPANFPEQRFFITLPSPYFSLSTNTSGGDNLFVVDGGSWIPNFDNYVTNLDNERFIHGDAVLETFGIGFKAGSLGITLGHSVKTYMHIGDTKNFLDLLLNGNAGKLGETVTIDTDFSLVGYQEFSAGVSFSLLGTIKGGIRAKYLVGMAGIETERANFAITTSEDIYQLNLTADAVLNAANVSPALDSTEFDTNDALFGDSRGFAFDIGAIFQIGSRFKLGISALDLGRINWKGDDVKRYSLEGDFDFNGLDVSGYLTGGESDFGDIADSLETAFPYSELDQEFSTTLSPKLYLSGSFGLRKNLFVTAIVRNEFTGSGVITGFGLGLQGNLGKFLNLGMLYSLQNGTYSNLGGNIAIKLGPLQVFAVSDNLLPFFDAGSIANTNFRAGLNFAFNVKDDDDDD